MIHSTEMTTAMHTPGAMDMSNTTSMTMPMMTPWLHLGDGDTVLFQRWRPVSAAAIAGVCAGLLILAVLDRMVAALRRLKEGHWLERRLALVGEKESVATPLLDSFKGLRRKDEGIEPAYPVVKQTASMFSPMRLIATVVTRVDIYRGALYGLQALTTYTLMLTAMTFHAAYIVSILVGLSIGEMLFGRLRPDTKSEASDACC